MSNKTIDVETLKIQVSYKALHQLLEAFNGPPHLVSEIQFTRSSILGNNNPVNILIDDLNKAVEELTNPKQENAIDIVPFVLQVVDSAKELLDLVEFLLNGTKEENTFLADKFELFRKLANELKEQFDKNKEIDNEDKDLCFLVNFSQAVASVGGAIAVEVPNLENPFSLQKDQEKALVISWRALWKAVIKCGLHYLHIEMLKITSLNSFQRWLISRFFGDNVKIEKLFTSDIKLFAKDVFEETDLIEHLWLYHDDTKNSPTTIGELRAKLLLLQYRLFDGKTAKELYEKVLKEMDDTMKLGG